MKEKKRCPWAKPSNDLYISYHDLEWGVPLHDERRHFEMLCLESAQAGLSWETILNKRENYRKAFSRFNPGKIARYDSDKIEELLSNSGIVRNKLKINSAINNAKKFLEVQKEFGSFDQYIWGFVDGKPVVNKWKKMSDVPATSPLGDKISKDLKSRGFKFVGPTIVYAHIQSIGLVNDHLTSCFRYKECQKIK